MNGWMILALVLVTLFLLGQIRVGVRAEYGQDGPLVHARLGPAEIQVFPRNPKQAKPKKAKPKKAPEGEPKESIVKKLGGPVELLREFLPLVLEAAGQFKRKLQVDTLLLELTVGGDDPGDTALLYGRANALLGALWEPLTRSFHVKDGRAGTRIDFNSPGTTVYGAAALSLKIGQILRIALCFGIRALFSLLKLRKIGKMKAQQRKAV